MIESENLERHLLEVNRSVTDYLRSNSIKFNGLRWEDEISVGKDIMTGWAYLAQIYGQAIMRGEIKEPYADFFNFFEIFANNIFEKLNNNRRMSRSSRDYGGRYEMTIGGLFYYPIMYSFYNESKSETKYSVRLF